MATAQQAQNDEELTVGATAGPGNPIDQNYSEPKEVTMAEAHITDNENARTDDQTENLTMSKQENGLYTNPWSTWKPIKLTNVFMFYSGKDRSCIPNEKELDKTLPIQTPDSDKFFTSPQQGVRVMWVGHATVLVQFDNITVLTDPIFSDRCFPSQYLGPKRYRKPPCTVADLPDIDAVVISHNHYDHLDHGTVKDLHNRFHEKLRWYVPMGLKKWFSDEGVTNVTEMDWWDEETHTSDRQECSGIKFVCTPCQHWSKRSLGDDNTTLWSSWAVIGPKHRFYFAGDTGYCEVFKQIGRKYGPFSFSAIPIGAYDPTWFMHPQHVCPRESVMIHEDVRSQVSLGIHWGTFKLTHEPYLEPPKLLKIELEKKHLDPSSFITLDHGQIDVLGGVNYDQVD